MSLLMDPIRIDVTTPSRSYAVTLSDGGIDRLARILDDLRTPERRFVVSSPLVWRLHGQRVSRALRGEEPILVPDGERYKQLSTVVRIWDALVHANADRASTLVSLGGGVIGDMTGFAAATYLRGIALVHVPTTLLAQVDSAIGGKVGVNHALGKNLIGAFYQPHAVVVDPSVLGTLQRREFRAGLYEVIKYGMTSSAPLFDRLSRERAGIFAREPQVLIPIIADSCRIKASVVSADEREAGPRRILNFGHTAGHAIEAVTSTAGSGTARPLDTACSSPRNWPPRAAPLPSSTRRRWPIPSPALVRCHQSRTSRRPRFSRRCDTTRRWSPAVCISSCQPRSAPRRSWTTSLRRKCPRR